MCRGKCTGKHRGAGSVVGVGVEDGEGVGVGGGDVRPQSKSIGWVALKEAVVTQRPRLETV